MLEASFQQNHNLKTEIKSQTAGNIIGTVIYDSYDELFIICDNIIIIICFRRFSDWRITRATDILFGRRRFASSMTFSILYSSVIVQRLYIRRVIYYISIYHVIPI